VTISRLDRVSIFGDKLSFLIPHEWVEDHDESQDVYLYHAPRTDSGWLRVSLITAKNSSAKARDLLAERARQRNGKLRQLGPNSVATWEKPSQEDGVAIYQYWWAVLQSLGPELIREALFSYTVRADHRGNAETQDAVSLLSDLFCNAEFSDPVDGTVAN
jgi:hypothetical protein